MRPFGTPANHSRALGSYGSQDYIFMTQYLAALRKAHTQLEQVIHEQVESYSQPWFRVVLEFLLNFRGNPQMWLRKFEAFKTQLDKQRIIVSKTYATAIQPLYDLCFLASGTVFPFFENQKRLGQNQNVMYYLDTVRYVSLVNTQLENKLNRHMVLQGNLLKTYQQAMTPLSCFKDDEFKEKLSSLFLDFKDAARNLISLEIETKMGDESRLVQKFGNDCDDYFRLINSTAVTLSAMSAMKSASAGSHLESTEKHISQRIELFEKRQKTNANLIEACKDLSECILSKALELEVKFTSETYDLPFPLKHAEKSIKEVRAVLEELGVKKKEFWQKHTEFQLLAAEEISDFATTEGSKYLGSALTHVYATVSQHFSELRKIEEDTPFIGTFLAETEAMKHSVEILKMREQTYGNVLSSLEFLGETSFKSMLSKVSKLNPYPPIEAQHKVSRLIQLARATSETITARGEELSLVITEEAVKLNDAQAINEKTLDEYTSKALSLYNESHEKKFKAFSENEEVKAMMKAKNAVQASILKVSNDLNKLVAKIEENSKPRVAEITTKVELEKVVKKIIREKFLDVEEDINILDALAVRLEDMSKVRMQNSNISAMVKSHISSSMETNAAMAYVKTVKLLQLGLFMIYTIKGSSMDL